MGGQARGHKRPMKDGEGCFSKSRKKMAASAWMEELDGKTRYWGKQQFRNESEEGEMEDFWSLQPSEGGLPPSFSEVRNSEKSQGWKQVRVVTVAPVTGGLSWRCLWATQAG